MDFYKGYSFPQFVEVSNLSKSFSDVETLRSVSFGIDKGSILGIIGPSGAGKSTLLRCLSLLLSPDSGNISIDSRDITAMTELQLRHFRYSIGQVFQHVHLFSSRTVFENVTFPLEIQAINDDDHVDELIRLVGLQDKRESYPAHLSGGQKQRAGIARALASKPKVLLCDEATSALDRTTRDEILKLLSDVNAKLGITIIFISHDIEAIRSVCTDLLVLDEGCVVEAGPTEDIFSDPKHPTTQKLLRYSIRN